MSRLEAILLRIGIDTGGTFTDIVRISDTGTAVHKVPSTPDDPGRAVEEALNILTFSEKRASEPVAKLLKSAVANADSKSEVDVDKLFVKTIHVDEGPTWRRWLPRAMGRATRIRKRTSHVTLVLGERD